MNIYGDCLAGVCGASCMACGGGIEPTRSQSYCDVGGHQACSGYTEDESDPETCMCDCHTEGCS